MNKLIKNMCLKPLILGGVAILAGLASAAAEAQPIPEAREWKSHDGNYSVKASMAGFNRATQRVSLSKEDATIIEVPLARLSSADQAYVAEQNRGKANPPVREIGDEKTLHGIRWQPEMEDALAVATGEATPDDDRPVMWFRVLGELGQDL